MANAKNPRDYIKRFTINESTWTEITITNKAAWVSVRQLGSETQAPFLVKHRSDDAGEDAEYVDSGALWTKNENSQGQGLPGRMHMQAGDTIGFFQRASGTGNMIMVVREHEG